MTAWRDKTTVLPKTMLEKAGMPLKKIHDLKDLLEDLGQCEVEGGEKERIDTEHLFGFMLGTDIGEVGEKEIQPVILSRFEKRPGYYRVFSPQLEYEFVPIENLRLSPGVSFAHYEISGVPGLHDRTQWVGQSASFDARYRFIDRDKAIFGFAIDAEPSLSRVDETSGEQIQGYGADRLCPAQRSVVHHPTKKACPAKLVSPSDSYLRRYRPSTPSRTDPTRYMTPAAKPAVDSCDHTPVDLERDTSGDTTLNAVMI
jgi:hypothetical protein